jgi:hypothetical protein
MSYIVILMSFQTIYSINYDAMKIALVPYRTGRGHSNYPARQNNCGTLTLICINFPRSLTVNYDSD